MNSLRACFRLKAPALSCNEKKRASDEVSPNIRLFTPARNRWRFSMRMPSCLDIRSGYAIKGCLNALLVVITYISFFTFLEMVIYLFTVHSYWPNCRPVGTIVGIIQSQSPALAQTVAAKRGILNPGALASGGSMYYEVASDYLIPDG